MNLIRMYNQFSASIAKLAWLPLLGIRFTLAYGFYGPARLKWADIHGIAGWFESMHYPAPLLNAYLSATTEMLGVVLLTLGLGVRIISFPLIIVMLVAIFTVHIGNGFEAGDNGFEIPLYYIFMLIVLIVYGSGPVSVDRIISDYREKKKG